MSVVQLAKTRYDSWDVARKVALDKLESGKETSVWEWRELVDDAEQVAAVEASASVLRCHTNCQTGNPYTWWSDEKQSKKCSRKRQNTAAGPSSGNTRLGQRKSTITIRPPTCTPVGDVQCVVSVSPTVRNLQRLCPCAAVLFSSSRRRPGSADTVGSRRT